MNYLLICCTQIQPSILNVNQFFIISFIKNINRMQIDLLLGSHLNNSKPIQNMVVQLQVNIAITQNKMQECIQKANSQNKKIKCTTDLNNYEQYLKAYRKQFAQKGQDLCLSSLKGETLRERQAERNQCVDFYMKGAQVLQENVKDKLHSILYKLDYSEL